MTHKLKRNGNKSITKKVYGSKTMLGGAAIPPTPILQPQPNFSIIKHNYTNSYIDFMIKTLWLCLRSVPIVDDQVKNSKHYTSLLENIQLINDSIKIDSLDQLNKITKNPNTNEHITQIYKILNSSELKTQIVVPTDTKDIYQYMITMYAWFAGIDSIKKCYDLGIQTICKLESIKHIVDWGEYIDENELFNLTKEYIKKIEDDISVKDDIIRKWKQNIDDYKYNQFLVIKPQNTLQFMLFTSEELFKMYINYPFSKINIIKKDILLQTCDKYYNDNTIFDLINKETTIWHYISYKLNDAKYEIIKKDKKPRIEKVKVEINEEFDSEPYKLEPVQPVTIEPTAKIISMKYFDCLKYIKLSLEQKRLIQIIWPKILKTKNKIVEQPVVTPADNFKKFYGLNLVQENINSKLFDICMYDNNPYIVMGEGFDNSINKSGFQVFYNRIQYNFKPNNSETNPYTHAQLRKINKLNQNIYDYKTNYVNNYYMNSVKTILIGAKIVESSEASTPFNKDQNNILPKKTREEADESYKKSPLSEAPPPNQATPPNQVISDQQSDQPKLPLKTIFTQKQIYNILFPPSTNMPDSSFSQEKINELFNTYGGVIIDVLLYIIYLITESYKASVNNLDNYQKHKVILFNLHKFIINYLSTTDYMYKVIDIVDNDINIKNIEYTPDNITINNNKTINIKQPTSKQTLNINDIIKINNIDITNLSNAEYNKLIVDKSEIKNISYKELNVFAISLNGNYTNEFDKSKEIFNIINQT